MYKRVFSILFCLFAMLTITPMALAADDAADERTMELPAPDKSGGMPLMKALAERKSARNLSDAPLSKQELSNILWAAWGMNREDGKHTIPTAKNQQKVAVYLANEAGVWIYDAQNHAIHKISPQDLRSELNNVGLTLAYAVEDGKYGDFHVGAMFQNVGLYCASAGLGNVVRASGINLLQDTLAPFLPSGFSIRMTHSIAKTK